MMIKKYKILILIFSAFIILLIGFVTIPKKDDDKLLKIESVPIYNCFGWGYNILVDNKVFIHQEYIPAIAGKRAFLSKEDAMKTAALAIEKLKKGKQPIITKSDLAALNVFL
ncbi:MAG: hypothetical protein JWN83_1674 [Chitinophagaceae bacterium]|nr:hypothetical protein [Chitinophagaceae bacterium]